MNKLPLWGKILVGFVLGIIVGIALKFGMGMRAEAFCKTFITPFGTIFLNLIKMLIIPLVFSSLFVGAASIGDPQKLGRVGAKTIALYLLTTVFAVSIGIAIAMIIKPGTVVSTEIKQLASASTAATKSPSFINTLIGIVPKNPVKAMVNGNILQIIFFALMGGIAAALSGDKGKKAVEVMQSFAEICYKLVELIMATAPIGVFALIAHAICTQGISILAGLAMVILCAYLGSLIHAIAIYGSLVKFLGKLPFITFFKGIFPAQMVAFSTCSSSGTLPASLECCEDNLGVSRSISSFVLPLGATINMDGTSLYQGVCVVFIAQVFGIDLSLAQIGTIIMTATLASIGTAGVPGAGVIMLGMVLSAVGLPLEGVAIIAGIDRILDMARTTLNITGDCAVNYIVARTEDEVHDPSTSSGSDHEHEARS
jgi:Na+/H+-dicarboxylate symporter